MIRFDIDSLHEIRETLSRNRSRTLLTGFGVFWGVFMMLVLMGGGQGLKALLTQTLEGTATNSGYLVPNSTSKAYKGFARSRQWSLTTDDMEKLLLSIPEIDIMTAKTRIRASAVYEGKKYYCDGNGVYPEYMYIEPPVIKYGRYINEVDIRQERKVCVIGERVYKTLFPEGGDPCGRFIEMNGIYYRIVGLNVSNGNVGINGWTPNSVVIPMTVLQKTYNRGNTVDMICMTAKPDCKIKEILRKARTILAKEHTFDPEDKKALFEVNAEEIFSIVDKLFKGVNLLIWLVGFGTLLAAAIGVSNIMMVTVKERTTEIGIRRAIGATPKMILSQILFESAILTLLAGFLGIVFSVLMLSVADIVTAATGTEGVQFQVNFVTAVLMTAMLAALGMLAGLPPALRAMNIKPVDAMRDE